MMITSLSSQEFRKIVKLLKRREQLVSQVSGIDARLTSLRGLQLKAAPRIKIKGKRKVKRTTTKVDILQLLRTTGAKGLSVPEIAKAIGRPVTSVSVWFYTAAKKIKGLQRVAPGRFAYRA